MRRPLTLPASLSFRQRMGVALARFASKMVWGRAGTGPGSYSGYGGLLGMLYGALGQLGTTNYAKLVGDPALTSSVSICLNWIADQFPEPTLQAAYRFRNGNTRPIPEHPLPALIDNPNPYYDGDDLWQATATDYSIDGNAFWYKARGSNGVGSVRELYHLPYWQVKPRADNEHEEISWYEYRVDGESIRLERSEIVHFRFGKDPYRRGRGISRLTPLLREIFTDSQAASYTAGLLHNMGVPGVLLQPKALKDDSISVVVDPESREQLESLWGEFTGDNVGRPLIPSVPLEVVPLALNPAEMNLGELMTVPVTRVCSALRLHPAIVNLGQGASPSAFDNGGQHAEARRAGYQDCILPMQKSFARTLERQLLPDFDTAGRMCLEWDYSQVEALAEDQELTAKRAVLLYKGGVAKRAEAREMMGFEVDPELDDVYCVLVKTQTADGTDVGADGQPVEENVGADPNA